MKDWLGGKWVHEARLRLSGDRDAAKRLVGYGRQLVGHLRDLASHGGSAVQVIRKKLPDGSLVVARLLNGQAIIEVFASTVSGVKERAYCSFLLRWVKDYFVKSTPDMFNELQTPEHGVDTTYAPVKSFTPVDYTRYGSIDWNYDLSVDAHVILYDYADTLATKVPQTIPSRYSLHVLPTDSTQSARYAAGWPFGQYIYREGRAIAVTNKNLFGVSLAFGGLILVVQEMVSSTNGISVYYVDYDLVRYATDPVDADTNAVRIGRLSYPGARAVRWVPFSSSGNKGRLYTVNGSSEAVTYDIEIQSSTDAVFTVFVDSLSGNTGYDFVEDTVCGSYNRSSRTDLISTTYGDCGYMPGIGSGWHYADVTTSVTVSRWFEVSGFTSETKVSSGHGTSRFCLYDGSPAGGQGNGSYTENIEWTEFIPIDLRVGVGLKNAYSAVVNTTVTGECCPLTSPEVTTTIYTVTASSLSLVDITKNEADWPVMHSDPGLLLPAFFGCFAKCGNVVVGLLSFSPKQTVGYKTRVYVGGDLVDVDGIVEPKAWSVPDAAIGSAQLDDVPVFLKCAARSGHKPWQPH